MPNGLFLSTTKALANYLAKIKGSLNFKYDMAVGITGYVCLKIFKVIIKWTLTKAQIVWCSLAPLNRNHPSTYGRQLSVIFTKINYVLTLIKFPNMITTLFGQKILGISWNFSRLAEDLYFRKFSINWFFEQFHKNLIFRKLTI